MAQPEISIPRRVDVPGAIDSLDLTTLGGRIAWARLRQQMTQKTLSQLAKKARATIVQYEQNNIDPPISAVQALAKVLKVSPEFIAFGRHGVEGVANAAEEIIPLPQIKIGRDGEYVSGGLAFPRDMIESFGVDPAGAKVFVLPQDATEFRYDAGDRLIVDTKLTKIDHEHRMYLLRVQGTLEPVRLEPSYSNKATKKCTFTGAKGNQFEADPADLTFVGAIVGSVRHK